MVTTARLNVTLIEPRLKHPTIFNRFDELEGGEGFIIENDHDPKPLYYQLLGERGNIFTWEYLEQGPEWWHVKITKLKNDKETVGEIAAKDYRKVEVFKKYGIDFCCGGGKTLQQASEEAGVSEEELETELKKAELKNQDASKQYDKWAMGFLADYIVNIHHNYVKQNAELVSGLAHKVAQHHGENHPELMELAPRVSSFLNELLAHMNKEEKILFPYIKLLESAKHNPEDLQKLPMVTVEAPVKMMMTEHDRAGEDMKFFRKATANYTLPADACNSYAYLFEKMKEFEADLVEHVALENNILFPKAIQAEKELKVA